MIGCEACGDWFHFDCIGLKCELIDVESGEYYCCLCEEELTLEKREPFKAFFGPLLVGELPNEEQIKAFKKVK